MAFITKLGSHAQSLPRSPAGYTVLEVGGGAEGTLNTRRRGSLRTIWEAVIQCESWICFVTLLGNFIFGKRKTYKF